MLQQPKLIALAAMTDERIIGRDGVLPWHLPEDLKFFKRTTTGHALLFGRTTFQGIGRPLPNRLNLVLSRSMEPQEGVTVLKTMDEVFKIEVPLIYICGGAEIYRHFFPYCDEVILTRIKEQHKGDTLLPSFEKDFIFKEFLEEGARYQIERWIK